MPGRRLVRGCLAALALAGLLAAPAAARDVEVWTYEFAPDEPLELLPSGRSLVVRSGDSAPRRLGIYDDRIILLKGRAPAPAPVVVPRNDVELLPDGIPASGSRDIARAWLILPTERYRHAVLGDGIEAGGLLAQAKDGNEAAYALPSEAVFEDLSPRLADLDRDGRDEIVVVQAEQSVGASLALFGLREGVLIPLAATPPIGTANRWLNPAGIGDFDGDGTPEISYVQTPHIGGVIHIWEFDGKKLTLEGRYGGFSNHAIGSRVLDQSAVIDWNRDGADDLVLPEMGRRAMRIVSFAGGQFSDLATVSHDAPIVSPVFAVDIDGDRRPEIVYATADNAVHILGRRR